MKWLKAFGALIFPPTCAACKNKRAAQSRLLCTKCLYNFPLTRFAAQPDNEVVELFWGQIPIVNGCALFWFVNKSSQREMIHSLKYEGRWRFGLFLGEWLGQEMESGGLYGQVDVVVPIPLHLFRWAKRGFNQSEYIAKGVAKVLERPVLTRAVRRSKYNKSQTTKKKSERWSNVEGIFEVVDAKVLEGKHILLVDDILTTGATIVSCAEEILRVVPNCKISVATLAASKSHLQRAKKVADQEDNPRIL